MKKNLIIDDDIVENKTLYKKVNDIKKERENEKENNLISRRKSIIVSFFLILIIIGGINFFSSIYLGIFSFCKANCKCSFFSNGVIFEKLVLERRKNFIKIRLHKSYLAILKCFTSLSKISFIYLGIKTLILLFSVSFFNFN